MPLSPLLSGSWAARQIMVFLRLDGCTTSWTGFPISRQETLSLPRPGLKLGPRV
ncbi:hypothetical protein CCUS01_01265 [Colletotrichum cuscutae]|uniref:Uncharacterized protein n=1 Tax=Colletotrichum cuscutae TaxID=1209917 RepID=A0AAI9UX49_9PEZI|nr:hypothetical protein CCUS01_01265 [Colletotrichum cuscutae]